MVADQPQKVDKREDVAIVSDLIFRSGLPVAADTSRNIGGLLLEEVIHLLVIAVQLDVFDSFSRFRKAQAHSGRCLGTTQTCCSHQAFECL